jgi:hypothetical protein
MYLDTWAYETACNALQGVSLRPSSLEVVNLFGINIRCGYRN